MAVEMFLKLEGPAVKGESKGDGHKEEIDIYSYSLGASNAGSGHAGGGSGTGRVSVQDLHITKYADKASTELFKACCNGTHFDKTTLIVRKAGGEKALDYMKIELKQAFVSSFQKGGSHGEDRIPESISFNFEEIFMEYVEQTEKGAGGTKPNVKFNVAENKVK
jgi:type VI secretion system secreted protein Hcp